MTIDGLQQIAVTAENNPTILSRVIQVIKRRRIEITELNACFAPHTTTEVMIQVTIQADPEQMRLVKAQVHKLIDVINVTTS